MIHSDQQKYIFELELKSKLTIDDVVYSAKNNPHFFQMLVYTYICIDCIFSSQYDSDSITRYGNFFKINTNNHQLESNIWIIPDYNLEKINNHPYINFNDASETIILTYRNFWGDRFNQFSF